jgi:CRISPR system Cascade subunit CasD
MPMATLLIPLVGPLQSWGLDSRFDLRGTAAEPSKSAIIGLACAALGRDRDEPVNDLAALRHGVRVDRAGVLLRDYHTAVDVAAAGTAGLGTVVSERWYLADAAFLCGLEGDETLLATLHAALADPRWPVFLGRKSCLPSVPLHLPGGLRAEGLETALREHPLLAQPHADAQLRLVIEDPGGTQARPDMPTGPLSQRQFGIRRVRTEFFSWNSHASP